MSHRFGRLLLCALPLGLALPWGCGDQALPATVKGLQSIEVTMVKPTTAELGSPGATVDHREFTVDLRAIDAKNNLFAQDLDLEVYLTFAGEKIGQFTQCGKIDAAEPLARVKLVGGVAKGQVVKLQRAYGKTALWFEEVKSQALGATPPIFYPNPTIPDVNTPLDVTAPTATYCTPFNGRFVQIDHATSNGTLVVTSLFSNGYVVADSGAPFMEKGGAISGGYNHLFVFAFGKPPVVVVPGRALARMSGNVSKFVGFTELNFPIQSHTDTVNPALMPPVQELLAADRGRTSKLIRLVSATVKTTGTLCPIDVTADDWRKFNNFGVDIGQPPKTPSSCDSLVTFRVALPGKTLGDFDPLALKPKAKLTVTGMLRNFSGQNDATSPPTPCAATPECAAKGLAGTTCVEGTCRKGVFNFWTINPRDPSDIVVTN